MPRQPKPSEYVVTETFTLIPEKMDPDDRGYRDVTVKREILQRRQYWFDKLGKKICTDDATGAKFRKTGKKDRYQHELNGDFYTRDRTKYG